MWAIGASAPVLTPSRGISGPGLHSKSLGQRPNRRGALTSPMPRIVSGSCGQRDPSAAGCSSAVVPKSGVFTSSSCRVNIDAEVRKGLHDRVFRCSVGDATFAAEAEQWMPPST